MGAIKTTPQVDQNGNQTGKMLLEITYGGKEAPFGGIDASAPPQYITPNCFVNAQGFLISSDRLIAAGFFELDIQFNGWAINHVNYLGAGTYYAQSKYWNWILGYTSAYTPASGGVQGYTTTEYFIWVWEAGATGLMNITSQLTVQQFDQSIAAVAAQATFIVNGKPALAIGSLQILINGVGGAGFTINPGDSAQTVMNAAVSYINSNPALNVNFSAALDPSGFARVTALAAGAAGNANVLTLSISSGVGMNPVVLDNFQGGADATTTPLGLPIIPLSWVAVGEILYFGGPGTCIIKFDISAGLAGLSILTQYLGAVTLGKYGGFLIAGGIVNGPGTFIQAPEMVIAWCANGQFGIWNPTDSNGFVTGAGFNEVTDLSDYITGFFITNSVAIVLHTQGIDYLTLLGNGSQPFDFEHISVSKLGEGCQSAQLVTQYDQSGFFVGNSDVFMYSNGLHEIGAKIRQVLLPNVNQGQNALAALAMQVPIDTISIDVLAMFMIGPFMYVYNVDDKTWMQFNFTNTGERKGPYDLAALSVMGEFGDFTQFVNSKLAALVYLTVTEVNPIPSFWQLSPFIQNTDFPSAAASSFVTFPSEEIEFGRDITIDGGYAAIVGMPGQVVTFNVTGQLKGATASITGTVTLGVEADGKTIRHYKVWFNGTLTAKAPQLTISVANNGSGVQNPLSIIKVNLFGSFEPGQRPV